MVRLALQCLSYVRMRIELCIAPDIITTVYWSPADGGATVELKEDDDAAVQIKVKKKV